MSKVKYCFKKAEHIAIADEQRAIAHKRASRSVGSDKQECSVGEQQCRRTDLKWP